MWLIFFMGQQPKVLLGRDTLHRFQPLCPVQPQQLKIDVSGCKLIQSCCYDLQVILGAGLVKSQQGFVHFLGDGFQLLRIHIQQLHQTFRERKVFFYGLFSIRCIGVLVVLSAAVNVGFKNIVWHNVYSLN